MCKRVTIYMIHGTMTTDEIIDSDSIDAEQTDHSLHSASMMLQDNFRKGTKYQ